MQKHKYLAIAISIVVGGFWIALVMYTFSLGKTQIPANPGVAAVSSAHHSNGVNAPTATFRNSSSASWSLLRHNAAVTPTTVTTPQATMSSTSMRVHETSSATVHQIGGGGMGSSQGVIATTSGSNKGMSYSGISAGGNMLSISSSLALAAPGASRANELASVTTSQPNAAPSGPRKLPGHEEEWWLTPVGDVAWPVILLLTIAWYVRVRLRKRQACK